jgi:serine/threonine protein kinase/tetratricopeptide (TPR) repeat protein
MAEVYLGMRASLDDPWQPPVAVKRLLPHCAKEPAVVRMFVNEAKITAQIQHPNVVKIVEVGEVDGEPFIVMELLDGHTFAEVRQTAASGGRRVPLGITLRILSEACRGLDAAHRAVDESGRELRIVHRDFTPDNIHVGRDGAVKVLDFGIAKSTTVATGTEPGTLKGKYYYMSPEIIAGRPVDHRADIFAAGVMLYEQLCGRRPFTGADSTEVLRNIAHSTPRRPTEFNPSLPFDLEQICLRALAKNPDDRFPTLLEFVSAIATVGGRTELSTAPHLAAYLIQLFPLSSDERHQALMRAMEDLTPPRSAPRKDAAAAEKPAPLQSRLSFHKKRASAAGALVLLAALAVWGISRTRAPPPTAAQRLEQAAKMKTGPERARLLMPLVEDARTTADQWAAACALLLPLAPEPALDVAEAFIRRFPEEARAHAFAARAAAALRRGKRAEAALDELARLSPREATADILRADLREAQGDWDGTLEALAQARRKQPGLVELSARQGKLLSSMGRLSEAEESLNWALSRKFIPESAAELGFVKFRMGQTDAAAALLKRAIARAPKLYEARYYYGAVLFRQGDAKGAEREYRAADAERPTDSRAMVALCQMQKARGDTASVNELVAQLQSRFGGTPSEWAARCTP